MTVAGGGSVANHCLREYSWSLISRQSHSREAGREGGQSRSAQ